MGAIAAWCGVHPYLSYDYKQGCPACQGTMRELFAPSVDELEAIRHRLLSLRESVNDLLVDVTQMKLKRNGAQAAPRG